MSESVFIAYLKSFSDQECFKMVSSVVRPALNAGFASLSLSIWRRYLYRQLWDCWVRTLLTTSTLGRNVQHINPFHLSKNKSAMQHSVQPGTISLHGGGNLPCFPACACLADPIQLFAQVGVLSGKHVLSYFPPNLKWAYKDPDPKWMACHAC